VACTTVANQQFAETGTVTSNPVRVTYHTNTCPMHLDCVIRNTDERSNALADSFSMCTKATQMAAVVEAFKHQVQAKRTLTPKRQFAAGSLIPSSH
jgi:hypothetical protein